MTAFESLLAFMVVAGVLLIPLAAIVTRKGSAIGEAVAERIRAKTRSRFPRAGGSRDESVGSAAAGSDHHRFVEMEGRIVDQQEMISELSSKVDFLHRLLESPKHPE